MRESVTKAIERSKLREALNDDWKPLVTKLYRINNVDSKTGYALFREITIIDDDPHGISKEDAIRMMGKDKRSSVYEVTLTIKRIA